MERDMTAGIPGKIILNFTIPIFIGNMFQQIYKQIRLSSVNSLGMRRWLRSAPAEH